MNLPGVSLTPACFAHLEYEDTTASRCFSNLLATGFRRFEIDLYWDVTRRLWSLCPVELGNADSLFNSTTSAAAQPTQTTVASLATGQLTDDDAINAVGYPNTVYEKQASDNSTTSLGSDASESTLTLPSITTTASLSAGAITTAVATGSASSATGVTSPNASEGTLLELGPYSCTTSINFQLFTDVLSAYLGNTETDLNATIKYLVMNLHAAAPAREPTRSAVTPSANALPRDSNLLSSILSANNSAYMYTPHELQEQRADLNASGGWYTVSRGFQPNSAYFDVVEDGGHASTPNGWPSESFIEIAKAKRLLVGYGNIDPQMQGYNFSGDFASIFAQGYLEAPQASTATADGVDAPCFFHNNLQTLSAINSSWAISTLDDSTSQPILTTAANLTRCGISPLLNETLQNVSAAEDYRPYQRYAYSTIWPWAPGEPRNISNTDADNDQQLRCAALNATAGRWQAADCTQSHFGACRVGHEPYRWHIGDSKAMYARVDATCDDDTTTFSTPRTALENSYLVAAWQAYLASSHTPSDDDSDDLDTLLWLNFNNLDAATCWVVGQNATCPYLPQTTNEEQQVVVPTVAGVVVFVLAVLTVFVKCAANRQSSRRKGRRRGEEGWDYEGVPS